MDQVIYVKILLIVSFEILISADELCERVLRIIKICLSVNNNSCGKLTSSLKSPIMLGDNLHATSASFFVANFNLLRI